MVALAARPSSLFCSVSIYFNWERDTGERPFKSAASLSFASVMNMSHRDLNFDLKSPLV